MDKEFEQEIYNNFLEAVSRFNFSKVYRVMDYIDWHWHGENHPPTLQQMLDMVENELFAYAVRKFKGEESVVYSGGFLVRIFPSGNVEIQFILEHSYNY